MELRSDFGERTINELCLMFRSGQINLAPGFQRKSVWSLSDRRRLIHSIARSYPVPCIFLYKRNLRGRLVYDVIDGKQRLESLFMFLRQGRFKDQAFEARLELSNDYDWLDWGTIKRRLPHDRHRIESYKIQTVEVEGDLSAIIDLFVRINSTGKPLTPGEKRHARFFTSRFLKEAEHLVSRNQRFYLDNGILSRSQLDRMKGTELVSELLMSIHQGGPINKKTALDRAIGNESVNGNTLARVVKEYTATLTIIKRLLPDIRRTRFRNTADFYSLFMLLWELRGKKLALTDRRRGAIAGQLLLRLSNGVDELRDRLRRAKPARQDQQFYARYLLTVQGDTDSAANRQRRAEILRGLLSSVFEFKDDRRGFSQEQRRLIWNREEKRACTKCRRSLTWSDFTVDHVKAWARGGKTALTNAQLLCRACNSKKGAR
ncbi:MAG: DUF262 domain-containing protein [Holophagales bacterium]|nr:MAG: DUF262 domain-containing protein [Holophagales bacterium]